MPRQHHTRGPLTQNPQRVCFEQGIHPRKTMICSSVLSLLSTTAAVAVPLPAGPNGMDPTLIPKAVTPLVIPPEMPTSPSSSSYNQGQDEQVVVDYNIAMRQFSQQILPTSGCKSGTKPLAGFKAPVCTNVSKTNKNGNFAPTTVWSYGRADDPVPAVAPVPAASSSFNYPAFSIEARVNVPSNVRWVNELVRIDPATGKPYPVGDAKRGFLPPLTPVDQSLHWANPAKLPCLHPTATGTDCEPDPAQNPNLALAYTGPSPMSVHVHGADVNAESDGYAESWWLPAASNIPAGYATRGALFDQFYTSNTVPGSAAFKYENDQPPTTLWYHDHTLGMTRNNVYSGPAGFWLLRGTFTTKSGQTLADSVNGLPGSNSPFGRPTHPGMRYGTDPRTGKPIMGCDPNFDAVCRDQIREIPVAIQDRSFNADGSLYFPASRNCFAPGPATAAKAPNCDPGLNPIPYKPADGTNSHGVKSDVPPVWNPEFFGNTMVVNGVAWPVMNVYPQRYRFRILNGSDARSLNMAMYAMPSTLNANQISQMTLADLKKHIKAKDKGYKELPFYQIGAEQGFLPKVVKITTGVAVELPGNGTDVAGTCKANLQPQDPLCERGLLMMPAERADVIVDFSGLAPNTRIRVVNTAPDLPFGGFAPAGIGALAADPNTTGRVMDFVVTAPTASTPADASVSPLSLNLTPVAEAPNTENGKTRRVALLEGPSRYLCVTLDAAGNFASAFNPSADIPFSDPNVCLKDASGNLIDGIPYAPLQALVGSVDETGVPTAQPWMDPVTASPSKGDTEIWEIYNTTVDAHPVHVHLVRFEVLSRETMITNLDAVGNIASVEPCSNTDSTCQRLPEPSEKGYKDTVVALPGEVTRVKATFERSGIYVWHCHIVDHEDNEMMSPLYSKDPSEPGVPNRDDPTLQDFPVGNTGKTISVAN